MSSPDNFDVDLCASSKSGRDTTFAPMTFHRDKCQNGLEPETAANADGTCAVRLAIRRGSYPLPCGNDEYVNERCELRGPAVKLGTPLFFGFDIRVERVQTLHARLVIAQVKSPYNDDGGGSPLFSLRIDDGHFFVSGEQYFESDADAAALTQRPAGGPCAPGSVAVYDHSRRNHQMDPTATNQVRFALATDSAGLPDHTTAGFASCTSAIRLAQTGFLPPVDDAWHSVAIHFAAMNAGDDSDGLIELSIDGAPIARATGVFGKPQAQNARQYLKLGPYRTRADPWDGGDCAVWFRDIRCRPAAGVIADRVAALKRVNVARWSALAAMPPL